MEGKATRMNYFQSKILTLVGFCSGLVMLTIFFCSTPGMHLTIREAELTSTVNHTTLGILANREIIRSYSKVEKTRSYTRRALATNFSTVTEKYSSPSSAKLQANEPPRSCPKELTFVLVKTHKTGSTTLRTILASFKGRKRRRKSKDEKQIQGLPWPFVGGYPGSFRRDLTIMEEFTSGGAKVLRPLVGSKAVQTVDFLMDHFRFNSDEVTAMMNPKAKYFTILREPRRQFESSFNFYYGRYTDRLTRHNQVTCHWYPYLQITQKFGTSFPEYLTLMERNLNETIPWFFRSMNPQSYDLGLDPLNVTSDNIIKQAKEIDEKFDLVLILEHLPESLVLLKNELCMSWVDIIPPENENKGMFVPHNLTDEEEEIVNHFTKQDLILYNYFNATLWHKIEKYGRERMKKDVKILNRFIELSKRQRAEKKSHHQADTHKYIKETQDGNPVPRRKKLSDSYEINKVMSRIIQQQGKRKIHPAFLQKVAKYMVENGGWCPR